MVDAKNGVDTEKISDGDTNKSIDMSVDMKIREKSAMTADMNINEKSDMSADMKINEKSYMRVDMTITEKSNIRLHKELEERNKNGDGKEDLTNISDGQVHPRDVEVRFKGIDFIKISNQEEQSSRKEMKSRKSKVQDSSASKITRLTKKTSQRQIWGQDTLGKMIIYKYSQYKQL